MKNKLSKEELGCILIQGENILQKGFLEKYTKKLDLLVKLLNHHGVKVSNKKPKDKDANFLLELVNKKEKVVFEHEERLQFLIEKHNKVFNDIEVVEIPSSAIVRQMTIDELFISRMDFFLKNQWRFNKKQSEFLNSIHDLFYSEKRLTREQKESFINSVDKKMRLK